MASGSSSGEILIQSNPQDLLISFFQSLSQDGQALNTISNKKQLSTYLQGKIQTFPPLNSSQVMKIIMGKIGSHGIEFSLEALSQKKLISATTGLPITLTWIIADIVRDLKNPIRIPPPPFHFGFSEQDTPNNYNRCIFHSFHPGGRDTVFLYPKGFFIPTSPSEGDTKMQYDDNNHPYHHLELINFQYRYHIYVFSHPEQFSRLGTENNGSLSTGCYYNPTSQQLEVQDKVIHVPPPPPPTLLDHAKLAWYETFFFKKSVEERRNLTTSQQLLHFVGWNEHADLRKGSGWLFLLAYVGLGGFIVTPLINIFTLLTEGLLKFLSEVLYDFSARWLSSSNPFSVMCGLFLGLLFLVSTGAYFLVRTITSPFNSVRDCFKVHAAPALQYLLATTSIICTLGFYLGIATISAPLLVLIGTKLGITSLGVALQSGALSHVGVVALLLLKNIGFTITPALTGAAGVAFFASITVFLNSMRNVMAEWLLKPEKPAEGPVVEEAPPELTPPPSASGPYLGPST